MSISRVNLVTATFQNCPFLLPLLIINTCMLYLWHMLFPAKLAYSYIWLLMFHIHYV